MNELQFNFFNTIILLGSLQGFMLSFLLVSSKQFNKKSNQFLALLVFVISMQILHNMLLDIDIGNNYPFLPYLPLAWNLLIPFTLYYFIQYLIKPDYKIQSWEYLPLVPFVLQILFRSVFCVFYLFQPSLMDKYHTVWVWGCYSFELLAVIYCLVVLILIVRKLTRYEQNLLENYAEIGDKSLRWLKNTMLFTFVLWVIWALPFGYMVGIGSEVLPSVYLLSLGMGLIIYWLGYSMYFRRDLFESPMMVQETIAATSSPSKTPELSIKTEEHFRRLLVLMEQEELYAEPELSMTLLAEKLGLSNGYLSQIINQKEGKNFFEFVNTYRVEAVKRKLKDPKFDHFSILGIAMDAGFKSKSTFNAVFKKMTGQTPSAFRKG